MFSACQVENIEQPPVSAPTAPMAQPEEEKQSINSVVICPTVDGPISLERYIPAELREEGVPGSREPSYAKVTPPTCSISPQGGVPPYEGKAYIHGELLASVSENPQQLVFLLPPMPPGKYKLTWFITDGTGKRGVGSKEMEWVWEDQERIQVQLETIEQNHIAGTNNGASFYADYELTPLLTNVRDPIESGLSVNYNAAWDFGDGNRKSFEVSALQGVTTVFHEYKQPGVYKLSVFAEGEHGQVGRAGAVVRVTDAGNVAVSGVGAGGWRLVRVIPNPLNAETLVEVPTDDTSEGVVIQNQASVGENSITIVTESSDGFRNTVLGQSSFRVKVPERMSSGERISLNVFALSQFDSGEHVLLMSGTPELEEYSVTASEFVRETEVTFALTSPIPLSPTQTLILEVNVDGCPSCIIRWVYEATG